MELKSIRGQQLLDLHIQLDQSVGPLELEFCHKDPSHWHVLYLYQKKVVLFLLLTLDLRNDPTPPVLKIQTNLFSYHPNLPVFCTEKFGQTPPLHLFRESADGRVSMMGSHLRLSYAMVQRKIGPQKIKGNFHIGGFAPPPSFSIVSHDYRRKG